MNRVSVMIVEDEVVVAMDIEEILKEYGCDVVGIAHDSKKAVEIFDKTRACILFMDINLGRGDDGITTAHKILDIQDAKIVYLTAFSDEETLDRAVLTKPSSYILKPFKKDDIRVALKIACSERIATGQDIACAEDGLLILNDEYAYSTSKKKLYRNGEPMTLSKKETKLLKLLMDRCGEIVEQSVIDTVVWEGRFVDDNARRNLIYRLRCKLNNKMIETIPTIGCRIRTEKSD